MEEALLNIIQSQAIISGSAREILQSMLVAVILVGMIYLHFRKFGSTSSSQESFAMILPFVGLTTFLVITVVKSSLALSLGLVGALSIVRFRTPIKDPEELAYIFLSIAAGIGLAANQITVTSIIVFIILLLMAGLKWAQVRPSFENLYITLDVNEIDDPEAALSKAYGLIQKHCIQVDVRRVEVTKQALHLALEARVDDISSLGSLARQVQEELGESSMCFIDNTDVPNP